MLSGDFGQPTHDEPHRIARGGETRQTGQHTWLFVTLGLGLAAAVPGRNPAIDGFGLIAFASLFPIITVLGYGQYAQFMNYRARRQPREKQHEI